MRTSDRGARVIHLRFNADNSANNRRLYYINHDALVRDSYVNPIPEYCCCDSVNADFYLTFLILKLVNETRPTGLRTEVSYKYANQLRLKG
jgi:hypothetical protein